jgi:hypothetical protein
VLSGKEPVTTAAYFATIVTYDLKNAYELCPWRLTMGADLLNREIVYFVFYFFSSLELAIF